MFSRLTHTGNSIWAECSNTDLKLLGSFCSVSLTLVSCLLSLLSEIRDQLVLLFNFWISKVIYWVIFCSVWSLLRGKNFKNGIKRTHGPSLLHLRHRVFVYRPFVGLTQEFFHIVLMRSGVDLQKFKRFNMRAGVDPRFLQLLFFTFSYSLPLEPVDHSCVHKNYQVADFVRELLMWYWAGRWAETIFFHEVHVCSTHLRQ